MNYYVFLLCFAINFSQAKGNDIYNISEENKKEYIEKYKLWKKVVENAKESEQAFNFFSDNPHWPLFKQTIKIAEQNINKINKDKLFKWFKKYPPLTKEGIDKYIDCLKSKDKQLADKYIKQTWIYQNLSLSYLEQFRSKYKKYLRPIEDAQRVKRIASQNDIEQLKIIKKIIDSKEIIEFIEQVLDSNVKVDSSLLSDPASRYRYIENLINSNNEEEAAKILALTNNGENKPFISNKFYEKRRYIAYNMLRAGKPKLAYTIASKYALKNGKDERIARLEFLLGFIAFRFNNKINIAKQHFENAYNNSKKIVRLSKNAFWLAEVFLSQKDPVAAIKWYRKASQHFSTFYGYLAEMRLQQLSEQYLLLTGSNFEQKIFEQKTDKTNIPPDLEKLFYKRELVQILIATKNIENNKQFRQYFYDQLITEIEDPYEELLLLELAKSNDEVNTVIDKLAKKQHYFINDKAYKELATDEKNPVMNINSDSCFISLVHSIIRQESGFKENATSSAGAIGMMQLMPTTAKEEAKIINMNYKNKNDLYNKYNNLTLGSSLLNRLMKKYKYNLVDVFYAYNAGPGNLKKFKNSINNLKNLTVLETIELIPIHETRIYVKNVMRNLFYYDQQFDCSFKNKVIDTLLTVTSNRT